MYIHPAIGNAGKVEKPDRLYACRGVYLLSLRGIPAGIFNDHWYIRFFGPCVLLVFLMFPSTSMSAPVSITVDNFTQFHQLEDTRFACYFDSGRQKSQLGKVNGNTLQESTAFRKLKFGKERKKLADKIKKQKAALKRAKGKSQRVRSNRARGSGNSKVTKLKQKLSETKALRRVKLIGF